MYFVFLCFYKNEINITKNKKIINMLGVCRVEEKC